MSPHAAPATPSPYEVAASLRRSPPWRLGTFRALRHRNYRLYFWGQFVSVTGTWVQSAALTWLAYDLTRESSWPALIGAVQVLPTFLLGAWGGSLADRWPKRRLIFLSQATLLVLALVLGGLVLSGHVTVWHLLAVAVAAGVVNAIDLPARLAFVIDMVGRDDLPNAIALNSMLFNTARAVGPAVSAVLFKVGGAAGDGAGQFAAGLCFLLNGLSFVAVLAALAWMDLPPPVLLGEKRRRAGPLWDGFRYLAGRPRLLLLLALSACMSFFGWPILSLLPAVADRRLGESTGGYAWMLSAIGGGALIASLLIATFGGRLPRRWFLAAGVGLSAASLGGLALVRGLPPAVGCCTSLGCGLILFFATSQAVMQLGSPDHLRGRVMGIWSMLLSGAHPLGHLLAGRAADHWGVAPVLAAMGLGIAAAAALVILIGLAARTAGFISPGGRPPG
jgi:MFS family permease